MFRLIHKAKRYQNIHYYYFDTDLNVCSKRSFHFWYAQLPCGKLREKNHSKNYLYTSKYTTHNRIRACESESCTFQRYVYIVLCVYAHACERVRVRLCYIWNKNRRDMLNGRCRHRTHVRAVDSTYLWIRICPRNSHVDE